MQQKALFLRRARRNRFALKKKAGGRARLSVFRSGKHIYAQVIDDAQGKTVVSASTLDKELQGQVEKAGTVDAAMAVGKLVAKRATEAGVKEVVFDRGGYVYHGRVKALADGAREGGLSF
jgi:large subunit ribosomal protein L18